MESLQQMEERVGGHQFYDTGASGRRGIVDEVSSHEAGDLCKVESMVHNDTLAAITASCEASVTRPLMERLCACVRSTERASNSKKSWFFIIICISLLLLDRDVKVTLPVKGRC